MYSQAGHAWQEMILCAGEKPLAFEASALLPRYPPADVAGCSSVEIAQVHVASVSAGNCVSDVFHLSMGLLAYATLTDVLGTSITD